MSESFEERVQRAIDEVVQTHQHDHPIYQETSISAQLVDETNRRAAFVLREQIDTDRTTPTGNGWLGDQFRYTLFYVGQEDEPKQLYEDHAYLSPSQQAFTDKRGRDPSIDLVALADDGVVAEVSPKECEGTAYSKLKVKITLDGRVEELENFEDQARNLITRIAPRLGYDYLSGFERLEGQDVAAVRFTTENGRTYGYDTLYLVWKDKEGALHHQELMDSHATKDYLHIRSITAKEGSVRIEAGGRQFTRSLEELLG